MLEKTYRHHETEARHYAAWEAAGAFACGRRPDAETYCIVIPPPNITGRMGSFAHWRAIQHEAGRRKGRGSGR